MSDSPTWLALAPPMLAIVCALITRRVVLSLLAGVCMGAVLAAGSWSPVEMVRRVVADYLLGVVADPGNRRILGFALFIGGLLHVISVSGGAHGLAHKVTRVVTSVRSGQAAAWGLGFVFFFDDYLNTLFVGSSMRSVTDRLRISREKLAFLVDATSAPVASLAPVSTWIVMELGYIEEQVRALELGQGAFSIFVATLPLRFYPVLMLAFTLAVALSGRDLGPMLKAERRARERVVPEEREAAAAGSWMLAALPIGLVMLGIVAGLYLSGRAGALAAGLEPTFYNMLDKASSSQVMVWTTLAGGVLAIVLAARQRALAWGAAVQAWVSGCWSMRRIVAILVLAWAMGAVCGDLGTADYLVATLGDAPAGLLPAAVFGVAGIMSFATGTSWGTMGILFPLAMPLAHTLAPGDAPLMLGTVSSILAGSVFGDHCSPISDTTIMSAMASGCDQLAHVRTQLPYALAVALVSVLLGSVPVGLGWWNAWVGLALGFTCLLAVLWLAGRRAMAGRGCRGHRPGS